MTDEQIKDQVEAINKATEKALLGGKYACLKFLSDAGIIRGVDEIKADKIAALKRYDFSAAADFCAEERRAELIQLREFVKEVAKGRSSESTRSFIVTITSKAKELEKSFL